MFSCFTFLAILQFCLFLDRRDITTAHEGRVASTAREMLADGDWIVPHSNGQPRILKPPLPYWAATGAWKISGGRVEVWLARLPAALCGAAAVLLIGDLARRVLGRHAAVPAGFVWISTWFIVDEYRKAMADPYLAFFTLLCTWSWVVAHGSPPTPRRSTAPPRTALLFVGYFSAALGALCKGPVILLHLVLALLPYHLIYRRRLSAPLVHAFGVLLFLGIALPWPALVARRIPNAPHVWLSQLRAEQATSGEKSSPPWTYLVALPQTSAPWTAFGVVGMLMPIIGKCRRDRRAFWPLIWLAATVLIFSLLPMKKAAYLLPAMPAQTLLIAAPIASALRARRPTKGDRLLFAGHAIAAGAAVCVTLFLVLQVVAEDSSPLLAASAVGLFLVIGARSLSNRLVSARTFALIALGFALAVHGVESWVWPERDNRRSDRPFADSISTVTAGGGVPLCVIGDGLREDVLFYLGWTVPVFATPYELPAGYSGYAIVTAEQLPATRRLDLGDEVGESSPQRTTAKDRLVLMKFPKDLKLREQRQR